LLAAVSAEDSDRQTVSYATNLLRHSVVAQICFVHARAQDEPLDAEAFFRRAEPDLAATRNVSFHAGGLESVDALHVYFEQGTAPCDEGSEERFREREGPKFT
jgi:hypothetical protein